jgi:hypothetical protein
VTSATETYPASARRVGWSAILVAAAVLGLLWALDTFVLRTTLLASRRGQPALTPLYAFHDPLVSARCLWFAAAAACVVWLAPRLVDVQRVSRARFVLALGLLALALPALLFVVRQSFSDLGAQSVLFEYQDFLQDAARVDDAWVFLRDYVATMPTLSLHGQHYPPGPMLYLHAWGAVFGLTPFVSGVAILCAFAAAALVVHEALREIASERAARQGALLLVCAPTVLDHAASALDAVFLLAAAISWWIALRAFKPGNSVALAAVLGAALYVTTLMSFSALPVGLAIAVFAVLQSQDDRRGAWTRLAIVGASYAACALLVYGVNGFALWDCLHEARDHAARFMGRVVRGTPRATWPFRTYGNGVGFAIGTGAALAAASVIRIRSGTLGADRWSRTALVALAIMVFAPLYYMETERIWLYAVPWVVAIAVGAGGVDDASLRRLLGASLVQALLMESWLFTYW